MKYLNLYNTMSGYTEASPTFSRPHVSYIEDEDLVIYDDIQPEKDWSKEYLTFLALDDGTFNFSGNTVNYSLDEGKTWTELAADTPTPTVTAGSKIMFKGNVSVTNNGIGIFSSTGNYEAMGNPYSLRYGDDFGGELESVDSEFKYLFSGSTGLTSAEHLAMPDIPLASSCYWSMFRLCASLTKAPALPATELAGSCYRNMFQSCSSLTAAPELSAVLLSGSCYQNMFFGCTSLNYIKMLATEVYASRCLFGWVSGVAPLGTFVKHPDADLESGVNGIPEGWTVETATE